MLSRKDVWYRRVHKVRQWWIPSRGKYFKKCHAGGDVWAGSDRMNISQVGQGRNATRES